MKLFRGSRTGTGRLAVMALLLAAWLSVGAVARAEIRRFQAVFRETRVRVGEPFGFAIYVETDGEVPANLPGAPDWGGLTVLEGPSHSQQMTITNSQKRLQIFATYTLIGDVPGEFTIGSARLEVDGRELATEPVTITVEPQDMSALPASLRDQPILHPVAEDPAITEQLRGRAFVLPTLSKSDPYVGEPITLSYAFYQERLPRAENVQLARPRAETMLAEQPFEAQEITPTQIVTLDGRDYDVAPLYRITLTPTQPGDVSIEGFGVQFRLPVKSSPRGRPRSGFDAFFDLDPAFSPMVGVEARAPALKVTARPVPTAGRPPDFSGTVGDFTLRAELDRKVASEDDLVTLRVVIEGEGNPALAAAPDFPASDDFEVFDRTEKTEKTAGGGTPSGTRTVEYLLRPRRSGTLRVPPLKYSIFNPKTEQFVALGTEALQVQVAPGKSTPVAATGTPTPAAPPEVVENYDYIKPLIALKRAEPRPLYASPVYWALQLGAAMLAGFGWFLARRRSQADPAVERRRNSWVALDFKLRRMNEISGPKGAEEAALALERALREFIADWFNIKAEGLTAPEISFRLMAEGLAKDKIRRIEDIMEGCAQLRYAPPGETPPDFRAWAQESRSILAEGLKS